MAIDLNRLPQPEVVKQLQSADILAANITLFAQHMPEHSLKVGDPVYNTLAMMAARETVIRQEFNDYSLENMLAYASGTNLDNLAVFADVLRADDEHDDQLRQRAQLAPEGYSTAGPVDGYIQRALNSAPEQIKSVSVLSPSPNVVNVYVLASGAGDVTGDGTADATLLTTVEKALNAKYERPLGDKVTCYSATIKPYVLDAVLFFEAGPSAEAAKAAALASVTDYIIQHHRLGVAVTRAGLIAALTVPGIWDVNLMSPANSVICQDNEAAYCTAIDVRLNGESHPNHGGEPV